MTTGTGYDHLLTLLESSGHPVKGTAAKCPAHEDGTASLSVTAGADGRALITCHAGCTFTEVAEALGAHPSDLFAEGPAGCRVCHPDLAQSEGGEWVTYDYVAETGELAYQVVRMPGKQFRQRRPAETASDPGARRDRDGRWWVWSLKGVTPVVYRWPEVVAAIAGGIPLVVVEGERDVETLRALGLVATCNSGGAGKWTVAHTAALAGAVEVTVVADADKAGRVHAARVARDLRPHVGTVRVVEPADGCKDVTDWCSAGLRVDDLPEWQSATARDVLGEGSHAELVAEVDAAMAGVVCVHEQVDAAAVDAAPVPYPAAILGPLGQQYAEALAVAQQVSVSLVVGGMLSVAASCMQRQLCVHPQPDWREELSLQVVVIGASGERKTPVMRTLIGPLVTLQAEMEERHEAECVGRPPAERPPVPGIYCSGTPEVVWQRWAAWGERASVFTDEPQALARMTGEYGGSAMAAQEPFLIGYSGSGGSRDRVTNDERVTVERACLTMLTGCQPSRLDEIMATMPGGVASGLVARLVLVDAVSMLGARDLHPPSVPDALTVAYRTMVRTMYEEVAAVSVALTLSPDATVELDEYRATVEGQLGPDGAAAEWGGGELLAKAPGRAVRYAALCHGLTQQAAGVSGWWHRPIGHEAMMLGVEMMVAETANAQRIYSRLRRQLPLGVTYGTEDSPGSYPPALPRVLADLAERFERGPEPVTMRDQHRRFRMQAWCRTIDDLAGILDWADGRNLVEMTESGWGTGRSRMVRLTATGRGWLGEHPPK